MKIVNGFVCECQDDARLAKRGIDPDNPQSDPVKQQELDEKRGKVEAKPVEEAQAGGLDPKRRDEGANAEAVQFGGALASLKQDASANYGSATQLLDVVA